MLQAGFLVLTAVSVLATSFSSGVFGMAGGMMLMGVLERLNDRQFRRWTQGLVMVIGSVYLAQGLYLVLAR